MRRWPLFWHIFPWFLGLTLATVTLIIVYAASSARLYQRQSATSALRNRAVLFAPLVAPVLGDSIALDSLCHTFGQRTTTRFTVVMPGGRVRADSDEKPSVMDNHADRPEVAAAFAGDTGVSTRYSSTLRRTLMYVAIPLVAQGRVTAVLRASIPLRTALEALGLYTAHLVAAGVLVSLIAVLLSLLVARRLSRPIEELTRGAERIARGELPQPLVIPAASETARLAVAMNAMAEELDDRIRAMVRKSNEQEAVLSAMVEGVIAADTNERLIMINAAGAVMLGITSSEAQGRLIQEAVRNVDVQRFLRDQIKAAKPLEREVTVGAAADAERTLEAHGTLLRGSRGGLNGVVVVLHDVTTLKRLESVRREFVANVSHELRTPLTSIKGFVETLAAGADEQPDERRRFLAIIGHHVERLNTLVEDLLTLSHLEKDAVNGGVELDQTVLDAVVKDAVEVCRPRADSKGIRLCIEGDVGVTARINPSLFEQALINLIDNAVRYSPSATAVRVTCARSAAEVTVTVTDQGPGIAPEHVPRLFERFYRVDKARSSKLGGTGLGLAIVKHILNVHGGSATVESAPGRGSSFALHLPGGASPEEKQA